MPSNAHHPVLESVQELFAKIIDMPYCTGTVQLEVPQSLLFYNSKDGSGLIDFSNPTETQLKALASACSPASFGRNKEDVMDDNYRKAGKLDATSFCTHFSPWDSGVLRTVVESLLKNEGSVFEVKAELYKLNVYGPGSFFKAHVDTPRTDMMFGSLVIVLPTPHTGGSLLLRHHNTEYVFDSTAAVSGSSPTAPQAAFAAFFSDVEHEVAEVTSGYRVTLTYNLYHTEREASEPVEGVKLRNEEQTVSELKNALGSVLATRDLLPDGGLLAFALSYEYPFKQDGEKTSLSDIAGRLKGVDALILKVCDALKLDASLKALYCMSEEYRDSAYCFMDRFVEFGDEAVEDSLTEFLCGCGTDAIVGYDAFSISAKKIGRVPPRNRASNGPEVLSVIWARPLDDHNSFQEQYIAYGNEASMACAYGKLCLVVHIDPPYQRVCR